MEESPESIAQKLGLKNREQRKVFESRLKWLRNQPFPTINDIANSINRTRDPRFKDVRFVAPTEDQLEVYEKFELTPPLSSEYATGVIEQIHHLEGTEDNIIRDAFLTELFELQQKFPRGSIVLVTKRGADPEPAKVLDYYARSVEDKERLRDYFRERGEKSVGVHRMGHFELLLQFQSMQQIRRVAVSYVMEMPRQEAKE